MQLPPLAIDPEGDPVQVVVFPGFPHWGTVTGNPPAIYRPVTNYFGTDYLQFRVHDGKATSAVGTLMIRITGVPDVLETRVSAISGAGAGIQINGEPYAAYEVEHSSNLVNWRAVQSIWLNASGSGSVPATNRLPAFYRMRQFR